MGRSGQRHGLASVQAHVGGDLASAPLAGVGHGRGEESVSEAELRGAEPGQLGVDVILGDRLDDRRRLSLERFTNIAENSFDAIACADDTGRLIYWNLAAQRLFGYAADEIIGQPAARLVHTDSLPQYHARLDLLTGAEQRLDTDRVAEVKVIKLPVNVDSTATLHGSATNTPASSNQGAQFQILLQLKPSV